MVSKPLYWKCLNKRLGKGFSLIFTLQCQREAEILSLMQTNSLAETIVQSVLSNLKDVVPIAEIVGRLVDKAVDEHRLPDMEAVSTTSSGTNSFEKAPLHPTTPSKIPSNS